MRDLIVGWLVQLDWINCGNSRNLWTAVYLKNKNFAKSFFTNSKKRRPRIANSAIITNYGILKKNIQWKLFFF